ncbi:unnamed protein product [Cylicocyclus nassatus]|uniref:Uncharacterized protein n=1 Tax=Cylicocyclus nassatus TaxID=53992 RepID=A0AA36GY52_CYLNA|nr:unnamed protein product [Cylicocyclus nassatus]
MAVTHVIFDFDGLLVDTESCYIIANQILFRKFGLEFTDEHNSIIMGRKETEGFPDLIKAAGLADKITWNDYLAQFDAELLNLFPTCKAMPGAVKLVRHLTKKGIPTAICSGSRIETWPARREPHKEWLDLIPIKFFCGKYPNIRGKPHPDPFLETMKRFPVQPSEPSKVLVFEDSPNGGRSAKAAGMKCIMVPSEANRKEALAIGVTQVLHSLEEFQPEQYSLPPYD